MLIGFLVVNYATIADNLDKPDKYLSGRGSNTRIGKYLIKHKFFILTCYFCLLSFVFIFGNQSKWIYLPLFIAGPIGIMLSHQNQFINLIQHSDLRNVVLVLIVYLPLLSFGLAKYNGLDVKNNVKYKMVLKIEGNSDKKLDSLIGFKYLGSAGNKTFLIKLDNSEVVLLNDNIIDYICYKHKD
jgi:hypothetical protein